MENKGGKILVAPCAYKGSFTSLQVADAIAAGVSIAMPDAVIEKLPIADGGDGTLDAILCGLPCDVHELRVKGPLDFEVIAKWLSSVGEAGRTTAILELASACGIGYLQGMQLSPMRANTIGLGQVILDALEEGFDNLIVTVGGSASTDGGTGVLAALGAKFLDNSGRELNPCGGNLGAIARLDLESLKRLKGKVRLTIASDVTNPLLGESGAAMIFAPQKGATQEQVDKLERGLLSYANTLEESTGKHARDIPGAGAAGGVPFGLICAMDAEIVSGFDWLSSLLDLPGRIEAADLVITAEGSLDSQSIQGKAIGELAKLCRQKGTIIGAIPAVAETGIDWKSLGIDFVIPAAEPGKPATLSDITKKASSLFGCQAPESE